MNRWYSNCFKLFYYLKRKCHSHTNHMCIYENKCKIWFQHIVSTLMSWYKLGHMIVKPSLAYPCQTLCLTIHIENSEICVAVTNRIWRGFELRSTCDHSTIRWLPVVVLWGINLSNVNFPEKLCSCDVGTEFSIIAHITLALICRTLCIVHVMVVAVVTHYTIYFLGSESIIRVSFHRM